MHPIKVWLLRSLGLLVPIEKAIDFLRRDLHRVVDTGRRAKPIIAYPNAAGVLRQIRSYRMPENTLLASVIVHFCPLVYWDWHFMEWRDRQVCMSQCYVADYGSVIADINNHRMIASAIHIRSSEYEALLDRLSMPRAGYP